MQHKETMLAFLLDLIKVSTTLPDVWYKMLTMMQSHTSAVLALTFQFMLMCSSLVNKILAMNTNNASSNDTDIENVFVDDFSEA